MPLFNPQRLGILRLIGALLLSALFAGCNNNPQPDHGAGTNTLYTAVIESSPRHLDPTASYGSNDTPYTDQIYEPLYGYHYLKRPYTLIPKAAAEVGKPTYLDKEGRPLPAEVDCSPR